MTVMLRNTRISQGRIELNAMRVEDIDIPFTQSYCAAFSTPPWNEKHHDPQQLADKWRAQLEKESCSFVGCRIGGEYVAGCEFAPIAHYEGRSELLPPEFSDSVCVNELWVTPGMQGCMIGRFLLANVEQMIFAAGATKISLWTSAAVPRLNSFYRGMFYLPRARAIAPSDGLERCAYLKHLHPEESHHHA